jgi:hypothetical protein
MKQNPEFSDKTINLLASSLGMPREEVVSRALKPWGIMGALKGNWPDYRLKEKRSEIEGRLLAAIEVVRLIEVFGRKDPGWVREQLKTLVLGREGEVASS